MENRCSTILAVDDNATNLNLVSYLLEFQGYRVITAMDAEEALAIAQNSAPDLILMDVGLPDMDGLTLTRKLKADRKTAHIIIVALTASAMKGDDQKALAAGCDGYITKPIDTRELPGRIAEFLRRVVERKLPLEGNH
jgi:CheY-like chemotaxis protein